MSSRFTSRSIALLACILVMLLGCRDRQRPKGDAVPRRIVSQTVLSDEILWELGEDVRARVVGVSQMVDDPTYSGVPDLWPAEVARVPGTSEALVSARPDLVVLAEFTSAETKALLAHAGIPTLELEGFDGFDAFRRHVGAIAGTVGAKTEGEALVVRFDEELRAVRSDHELGLTVVSWVDGMVAGERTTFDDQARAAGLVNVAAREGIHGHRPLPIEQLTTWDPDLIIVSCHGDCTASRSRVLDMPGISATKAARGDGVLAIESRLLFSTGLGMIEVVKIMQARGRGG